MNICRIYTLRLISLLRFTVSLKYCVFISSTTSIFPRLIYISLRKIKTVENEKLYIYNCLFFIIIILLHKFKYSFYYKLHPLYVISYFNNLILMFFFKRLFNLRNIENVM